VRVDRLQLAFPADDVFTARIALFDERFPDQAARQRFWEEVEERVAGLPGVLGAGLTTGLPGLGAAGDRVALEGVSYEADRDLPFTRFAPVSPGFFETFQVEPLQGRVLNRLDGPDAAPVVVVNRSFARDHFPDGQVLGRRIRLGDLDSTEPWREVVGVVADLGMAGVEELDDDPPAGVYVPLAQSDARFISVAARVDGPPLGITTRVRDAVAAADADTPIYFADSLRARIDQNLWFYKVFGALFASFGAAALFLASVGLYGVMSFSVSRRVPEMGIRMALGAEGRQVRALILRQGLGQIVLGMALGTGLAVLVARGLTLVFYGSRAWDPATYATVFGLLCVTGLAASIVPAMRATRVDPVVALRSD
jgi:predicted permease